MVNLPTSSTSLFVNSHFVNIDQIDKVGIDQIEIDKIGIDKVGITPRICRRPSSKLASESHGCITVIGFWETYAG